MFEFHNLLVLIDDHKASGKSYIWCLADESLQPCKITKFVEKRELIYLLFKLNIGFDFSFT